MVVVPLPRLSVGFFDVFGHEEAGVEKPVDVGDVVVLYQVDTADGPHHEMEAAPYQSHLIFSLFFYLHLESNLNYKI